ncbi:copper homeostasis protein CutC [Tabrizicola sp. TH137]|uniref:copper homeostasis protein CutC n=1 Tax=Tabrizicola sp. TH137 TaxID=2067452 RepID=UPI000C7E166A|nr:copper homeostasis protein CutC [Tabrizicola sp. TH137]PLL14844.1 copper homeostasis protein CutC [Tabrizicola sp. TH137]
MADILLEVCVEDATGLAAAIRGGAGRIELCSALALGGLTPSPGLMAEAARASVPVMAMIRPRAGGFLWSSEDLRQMKADIAAARSVGLAGVVLGASRPDGRLDEWMLSTLLAEAEGMDTTLHRCFDLTPDRAQALETAIALGFSRILTSGGAATAPEGVDSLAALMQLASRRITVMPGSGIRPETLSALAHLPLREIHASCSMPEPEAATISSLGFGPPERRVTSDAAVRALTAALKAL